MSFLDTITDNISKVTESALDSSMVIGDLLNSNSNGIIDSMKSLPGISDLQNMGFPMFDNLIQSDSGAHCGTDNYQGSNEDSGCGGIFDQIRDINEYMNNLFGENNPCDCILGGQEGQDQSIRYAIMLLSGNPGEMGSEQGSGGGGGGGLFGDIFGSIKGLLGGGGGGGIGGILGGILGGGSGGGGGLGGLLGGVLGSGALSGILGSATPLGPLLPLALKVAPLLF